MNDSEILTLAEKLATELGIAVKNKNAILKNMRRKGCPTTTILRNRDCTLWIDKHYVAFSEDDKPNIRYVFITRRHIAEHMPEIRKMLKDCAAADRAALTVIREQMREALKMMAASGEDVCLFDDGVKRERVSDAPLLMTLCAKRVGQFYDTPDHRLERAAKRLKQTRDYCDMKQGYEYKIVFNN
jgi:hypothetical protein